MMGWRKFFIGLRMIPLFSHYEDHSHEFCAYGHVYTKMK
jgi:hypothetical protein